MGGGMCQNNPERPLGDPQEANEQLEFPEALPTTSFHITRINSSTYLIVEDEYVHLKSASSSSLNVSSSFKEQPHIYVKVYANILVITDTGCNSPRNKDVDISSLKQYLEKFPVQDGKPLNENGTKNYIILCTHAHYDHILGIPTFLPHPHSSSGFDVRSLNKVSIMASNNCKSFIEKDFDKHSLCHYIGVPPPKYSITHWLSHLSSISDPYSPSVGSDPPISLRLQVLHTPGHTPDSLSWYDIDEAYLYVGDTFYARRRGVTIPGLPDAPDGEAGNAAIQFPVEGNWDDYMASLDLLHDYVKFRNLELKRQESGSAVARRVKIACGHISVGEDAEEMIAEVKQFFMDILRGLVPVKKSIMKRGEVYDFWEHVDEGRFDVLAPRRLNCGSYL